MDASEFQGELDKREAEQKGQQDKQAELKAINKAGIKNVEATNTNTRAVVGGVKAIKAGVKVTNPDLAKTQDVADATEAIRDLNLTAFMANKGLPELADNLTKLNQRTQDLQDKVESEGLTKVTQTLEAVVKQLIGISKSTGTAQVTVDKKLQGTIDNLTKQIGKIDFKPSVNVSAPETKVVTTPVDFAPILKSLQAVQTAIENKETPDNRPDLDPVISGLSDVQNAITSLRFPVPNYVLPFKDINGKDVQVQLDASGNIPVTGGGSGGGGTQYTDGAAAVTHPIGTQQVFTNGSSIVTAVSTANPLPVSATFSGTVTSSPTFAQNPGAGTPTPAFGLIDSFFRPQVSVATALPAGTNVIGHVITDSGSTTAVTGTVAVTQSTSPWIVAGGGTAGTPGTAVLAVQGVASGTALPVSGTFWQATQPVSLATNTPTLQSGSTTTVTQATATNLNATVVGTGTFVTQTTLAAETTKVIGTVNQGTSPWVVSGTVTANAGTNLNTSALATSANQTNATQKTQIVDGSGNVIASTANALNVAITSGGGSGGTSSSFASTFPATGTAIGVKNGTSMVNLAADGSSNLLVSLNTAIPAGSNAIGSITNTSFTATQATGTNLHTVTDSGSVTAATLSAETTKVIGTVNQGTSPWVVSGTVTANAGTNLNTSALALDATLTGGTQRTKLTDGTNNAAVKAASTAAIATDPAVVVAISPNNTVPVSLATNTPTLQSGSTTAVTQTTASNLNAQVGGLLGSGVSLTTNPVTAGGLGKTANPTAVSDGQVVNTLHDKLGKQIVAGSIRDLKGDVSVTLTASTAETTLIAAVASTFLDVYGVIIANTSATVAAVSFRDVATGTVRFVIEVPPNDTRGFILPESAAWKQATVNTAWTIQSGTSVSSLVVSALYIKNI